MSFLQQLSYNIYKPQAQLWLVVSVCSYSVRQGTGNRDYCAVATWCLQVESVLAWLAAC